MGTSLRHSVYISCLILAIFSYRITVFIANALAAWCCTNLFIIIIIIIIGQITKSFCLYVSH